MRWIRLECSFPDHPKIIGLSDHAVAAWVRLLAYCGRHETDGVAPRRAALACIHDGSDVLGELVAAGLWVDHGDAIEVHGWSEYQQTRAQGEAARAAAASRQQAAREARASRRDMAVTHAVTHGVTQTEPETATKNPMVLTASRRDIGVSHAVSHTARSDQIRSDQADQITTVPLCHPERSRARDGAAARHEGGVGRPSDVAAVERKVPEDASRHRLGHAPSQDTPEARIRAALGEHEATAPLASDGRLAATLAGRAMASGTTVEQVVRAIGDAAARAVSGETVHTTQGRVVAFADRAKDYDGRRRAQRPQQPIAVHGVSVEQYLAERGKPDADAGF